MLALRRADTSLPPQASSHSLPPSSPMPALFPPTPSMALLLVTPQPVSSFNSNNNKSATFAYERPSTSLGDLEIVRKIVECEGCIEALQHLVNPSSSLASAASDSRSTPQHRELETDVGYCYMGPRSVSASRKSLFAIGSVSPMVAPMVVQSVLDQLRVVGVQIVEMVVKWRRTTRDAQTFQWRGLNYLLKMTTDLDFLVSCATTIEPLRALRLERNPLLSALHLDHPLLVREARRESVTPEVTAQLQRLLPDVSVHTGGVDRLRLFEASKVLAAELAAERRRQHLQRLSDQFGGGDEDEASEDHEDAASASIPPPSVTKSVHWSHRPVTFTTRPPLGSASRGQTLVPSSSTPIMKETEDELVVARELLAQAEHEFGALREQLATLQRQLKDADEGLAPSLPPDKRRRLQTRIGGMVNDLKFRSGDVFQRRNELRRREKASDRKGPLQQQQQQQQRQPQRQEAVGGSSRPTEAAAPPPDEPPCENESWPAVVGRTGRRGAAGGDSTARRAAAARARRPLRSTASHRDDDRSATRAVRSCRGAPPQ